MPKCSVCEKELKRDQDLKMHMTKVHGKKKKKTVKKIKRIETVKQFSKLDLISIIQVKIDSLKDVLEMLRNL